MTLIWNDILKKSNKDEYLVKKEEIEFIESHDYLTKLPHRAFFKKRIRLQCEEFKEEGKSFALMMIDINGFKYINNA